MLCVCVFFFQAEDGIRDLVRSRGLGDVYKRQQRPILETSIVSPNGFFRVHYDLSGINALSYNLELLLQALDSAYSFEINYLGFPTPPTDGSEGGDGKYDIYVQNLSGLYGYTQFENKVAESSWTSFMVIDNDYVGYYSTGIDGAKVTVAHEFHHAIQGGSYAPVGSNSPFRGSDVYYYEITSTSMEEFVQDNVNDYYAYMSTYFQHPENAMPNNDGYNLAIWNIFLQKRFGFDILKNQWELIPTTQAIKAIALSLNDIGSTLGNELNKFGIWTYFTNSRNYFPTLYFEEASEYPLLSTTAEMNFNLSTQTYNMSVNPCANYFLKLNLLPTSDIFYTIVTNSDYQKAIDDPDPVSYTHLRAHETVLDLVCRLLLEKKKRLTKKKEKNIKYQYLTLTCFFTAHNY